MATRALTFNPKNIDGSLYVDSTIETQSTTLGLAISTTSSSLQALVSASQNVITPSYVTSYNVTIGYNTSNCDGASSKYPTPSTNTIYNVPSNGISYTGYDGINVIISSSESNLDLTPLILSNGTNLTITTPYFTDSVFGIGGSTNGFYVGSPGYSPNFTFCDYNAADVDSGSSGLQMDYANAFGVPSTALPHGFFSIWFQYQFTIPYAWTNVILSVADYTQSPYYIFVVGTNDSTFNTRWNLVSFNKHTYTFNNESYEYPLTVGTAYKYWRICLVSSSASTCSISGVKFVNSQTTVGANSFGTGSTSTVVLGSTQTNIDTKIQGSTIILDTPYRTINFGGISGGSAITTGWAPFTMLGFPGTLILDCSRNETTSLIVNTTTPLYQLSVPFTCVITNLTFILSTPSVGSFPNFTTFNYSIVPFSGSTVSGSVIMPSGNTMNNAQLNFYAYSDGSSRFSTIKIYVASIGGTTPGAGLKVAMSYYIST